MERVLASERKSSRSEFSKPQPAVDDCYRRLLQTARPGLCVLDLAERIRRKVKVSGRHHLWTGAADGRGSGHIRVNGKLTTVRRVVWNGRTAPCLPQRPSGSVRLTSSTFVWTTSA